MQVRIKSINKQIKEEVVYNFSVQEDESYVIEGVISHNCRCALAPASEALEAVDNADIEKEFSEWLEK